MQFFEQCAADPSLLIDVMNLFFPELIAVKECLTDLLNIKSDQQGLMLKQCLPPIVDGFATISERMLEDHLICGKYSESNEKL